MPPPMAVDHVMLPVVLRLPFVWLEVQRVVAGQNLYLWPQLVVTTLNDWRPVVRLRVPQRFVV